MHYHSATYARFSTRTHKPSLRKLAYAVLSLITGDIMFYYIQHTVTTLYLIRNFNLIPYYA